MPQGNVLVPLLFNLYSLELFSIFENKLIGYADNSTLMAGVLSPGVRVTAAEPRSVPSAKIVSGVTCGGWSLINASKTKTMIVSRSFTMHSQWPPLTIGKTMRKEPADLVILAVTFYPRWPLRSIFTQFHEQLLIDLVFWLSLGQCSMIDHILGDAFWGFVLLVF